MARKKYSKFTITSLPDPSSGAYEIPDYERDMKTIVNQAVKSALSEGGYYKARSRVVNKATGETRLDVYVHSEDADVVRKSLNTQLQKLTFRDVKTGRPSIEPKYTFTENGSSRKEDRALQGAEEGINTASRVFSRGAMLKLVALLTTIAHITRRILSAVLTNASQTARDAITAHNMGVSYETIRKASYIEKAHGLPEGTIPEAYSELITAFGNITELDTEKLSKLAVVMGGEIEKLAKMGLATSDPDKLTEAIVNAFNEQADKGYNTVGEYVGEQQARRELYAYLNRIFPKMADIFASMQDAQHNIASIYKGVHDYQSWKDVVDPNRGDYPQSYINVEVTTGELENLVRSILSQIKKGILLEMNPTIEKALRRIADMRIGMSASENAELNRKNASENEAYVASLQKTLKSLEGKELTIDEQAFKKELEEEIAYVNKALEEYYKTKGNIGNLTRSLDNVRITASRRIDSVEEVVGTTRMDEAIALAIKDNVSDEEIQEAKNKLIMDKRKELMEKARVKKHAEFTRVYNQLASSGMNKKDIMGYMFHNFPELVAMGTVRKDWKGRDVKGYVENTALTAEETNEIIQATRPDTIDDMEVYRSLLTLYPAINAQVKKYVAELAKKGIDTVGASSLLALYESGDLDATMEQNLPADFASVYGGYGMNVIGLNTQETPNSEVVHKIVLDVNNNGKLDKEDIILGEFLGFKSLSGVLGELRIDWQDGKPNYYIGNNGTSASVQAQD